jgi:D-alanyl-D-alanine carboxypeptidase
MMAGLVVERVTGQRLAAQLQQRILRPLALDGTELPATERRIAGPHVHGYAPPDKDWRVSDGARFYQALLGGQLLTPELLKQMRTTVDASQLGHGTRYGLGLEVLRPGCAVELWGHGGSLEGYGTGAAAAAVENILRREVSC